jgi:hypothetical protein
VKAAGAFFCDWLFESTNKFSLSIIGELSLRGHEKWTIMPKSKEKGNHMCGQGRGHHGGCGCHGGRHEEHHEEHGCGCDKQEGHGESECGCHEGNEGTNVHFERQFATRAERIAQLEVYVKALQTEAKAAEERIAEMKAVGV